LVKHGGGGKGRGGGGSGAKSRKRGVISKVWCGHEICILFVLGVLRKMQIRMRLFCRYNFYLCQYFVSYA
jgi:hypothetical protein